MAFIMVDIETDGPIPGDYSMIELGAVLINDSLDNTFYGQLKPISGKFKPDALAVSGYQRDQTLLFEEPSEVIKDFANWLQIIPDSVVFISDNNGFDWMFVAWYFHHFLGKNPFGYNSQNLNSLYKGLVKDVNVNFKNLMKSSYSHNALNDALKNAQFLLDLKYTLGLKIGF